MGLGRIGLGGVLMLCAAQATAGNHAQESYSDAAKRWLQEEFSESTLTPEQQMEEMEWFIRAAEPYRGMSIRVVSEDIKTHWYEASIMAKAFTEITGIHVVQEYTPEDDVVKKITTQMDTGLNLYDAYINDSDFIGTHYRRNVTVPISDYINDQWRDITLPTLDLDDFIGIDFGRAPDGKLYQLPSQQFANLYWYRHDWFSRNDLKKQFEEIYGYSLDVPRNWAAYEDIAEFFTHHVQEIDGKPVWGHMDYGGIDPSLGWRISDSWLGMAGAGDKGLPNGLPVDDWGIRVHDCHPVGASVSRGGAINAPASVYAIEKYLQWLKDFAPPDAGTLTFTSSATRVADGQIAQQIFWYTGFVPEVTDPDSEVVDENGMPLWRIAPSPVGPYWEEGMKSGYQDAGSWTFLLSTPPDRLAAAWLYAQFTVAKSTSLSKLLTGLTPIRKSNIESDRMTEAAPRLGGLVEFYRSQGRKHWTPTGTNVPDYGELAPLWWKHILPAVKGEATPKQALDSLAEAVDDAMAAIALKPQRSCGPRLNKPLDPEIWLNRPGAPKAALSAGDYPAPETQTYEQALKRWDRSK